MIDPIGFSVATLLGVGIGLIIADRRQARKDAQAQRAQAERKAITERMDQLRTQRALQLDPTLRGRVRGRG